MVARRKIDQFGILVGGGSAPGINSVIQAVVEEADRNHCQVLGIYDGFKHLMQGKVVGIALSRDMVGEIYQDGGSILHSARANPTRSEESLRQCAVALQNGGIDALITIGGDDTAFSASQVARYAQEGMGLDLLSAHVPKTIDNDLPLPGDIPTFGFETARELGTRLVMNIKRDAFTMQHWFLVLSMGRNSGHLALGVGHGAATTLTLIPEEWDGEKIRLHEVVDIIVTTMLIRLAEDKPYGVAILAEGLLENLAPEDLNALEHVARDEHGHVRLPDIHFLDVVKMEIDKVLAEYGIQLTIRRHDLGYELRCAPPIAWDIEYTRGLGVSAVEFLLNGGSNAIITLQDGQMVPIPYQVMINPKTGRTAVRKVDRSSYRYTTAYKLMTRLKPEHTQDDLLLQKLATLTHLTVEQFLDRYGYLMKDRQP